MEELKKIVSVRVGDFSELPRKEQKLLEKAARARLNAQAPYSNYLVGVAVLSAKGTVHCGCNVERCSWTQTTHAEQNAIDSMIVEMGPIKIEILALVAAPTDVSVQIPPRRNGEAISRIDKVPVPCGHCLQIIWENCFQDPQVKIIALAANGQVISTTIGDALPMRFGPEDLGIDYNKQ